jgi:rhamnose utilization protein RhaD (predicted bifunctional aldolase and dehydrogenase)
MGRPMIGLVMETRVAELIELGHQLGQEQRGLAILGEGNISAKLSEAQFAVKASGCALATLSERDVTVCDTARVLAILKEARPSDEWVEAELLAARVNSTAKKPSLEAMFHASLLAIPEVQFVAHCHPVNAVRVLSSRRAAEFAEYRMFPDHIVYCGARSVFVPYCDPGLPLAREIAQRTAKFHEEGGAMPKLILLENHGTIAIGPTMQAVLACTMMAEKAAAIFVGAATLGGPKYLSAREVERIATRRDEVHRRRGLE